MCTLLLLCVFDVAAFQKSSLFRKWWEEYTRHMDLFVYFSFYGPNKNLAEFIELDSP